MARLEEVIRKRLGARSPRRASTDSLRPAAVLMPLIVEADRKPLGGVDELRMALSEANDNSILLLVQDGKFSRYVVVDYA